jgi:hypothetical protein
MNLDVAKEILKDARYRLVESDAPMTSSEWYSIAWRWKEKLAEQEDLLKEHPLWPGTPAELKTKNLIKKYKGYYEQALKKAQELEYQEEERISAMKYYEDLTRAEW